MASFAHVAVGIGAGSLEKKQPWWQGAILFSALSLLPDADVIGFKLGIDYSDPLGHRGATHSLVFAGFIGLLAYVVFGRVRQRAWLVFAVVVSHPLLDMLTDGGLGCALLWPFTSQRFFWPWQPIPVAPIGAGMLSRRGAFVMAVELAATSPLLLAAFLLNRTRRSRTGAVEAPLHPERRLP